MQNQIHSGNLALALELEKSISKELHAYFRSGKVPENDMPLLQDIYKSYDNIISGLSAEKSLTRKTLVKQSSNSKKLNIYKQYR